MINALFKQFLDHCVQERQTIDTSNEYLNIFSCPLKKKFFCLPVGSQQLKNSGSVTNFLGNFVILETATLHPMTMKSKNTICQNHCNMKREKKKYESIDD